MAKLSILHISDLHIGNFVYDNVKDLAISIVEDIETHDKHVDCIAVTGDIFDGKSNKKDEIDIKDAMTFFNTLKKELNRNSGIEIKLSDFIFVPGNHDQVRVVDGDCFSKYRNFLKSFYGKEYYEKNYNEEHLYTIKIYNEKKIVIVGLNSCMIEQQIISESETKWLEEVDFIEPKNKVKIKGILKKERQKKWDD